MPKHVVRHKSSYLLCNPVWLCTSSCNSLLCVVLLRMQVLSNLIVLFLDSGRVAKIVARYHESQNENCRGGILSGFLQLQYICNIKLLRYWLVYPLNFFRFSLRLTTSILSSGSAGALSMSGNLATTYGCWHEIQNSVHLSDVLIGEFPISGRHFLYYILEKSYYIYYISPPAIRLKIETRLFLSGQWNNFVDFTNKFCVAHRWFHQSIVLGLQNLR